MAQLEERNNILSDQTKIMKNQAILQKEHEMKLVKEI